MTAHSSAKTCSNSSDGGELIVVVPTYNEAASIALLLSSLHEALPLARAIVVDDNSPDGTAEVARRAGGWVEVVVRGAKMGLGSAYREGFRRALESGRAYVAQLDADLSHDPRALVVMLGQLDCADVVVGSRYVVGGSVANWSGWRRVVSRAANLFARVALDSPIADLTSGFKLFRREVLVALQDAPAVAGGYAFQVETTTLALRMGFRVCEVAITFDERAEGRSKIAVLPTMIETLTTIYRLRAEGPGIRSRRTP